MRRVWMRDEQWMRERVWQMRVCEWDTADERLQMRVQMKECDERWMKESRWDRWWEVNENGMKEEDKSANESVWW